MFHASNGFRVNRSEQTDWFLMVSMLFLVVLVALGFSQLVGWRSAVHVRST
jgi:hypothetical protein